MRNLFLLENIGQLSEKTRIIQSDYTLIDLDNFTYNSKERSLVALDENFDKDLFEKKYLDLIALLGNRVRSIFWWANALSEKNSFTSKLFSRLYKLICLDETIKKPSDTDIIIICSDRVLIQQIIFNYRKNFKIFYSYFHPSYSYFRNMFYVFKGILSQACRAFSEYRNVLFARRVLHERKIVIEKQSGYTVLRTWVDHRNYKSGLYKDTYFKDLLSFFSEHGKKILIFAGVLSDYKNIVDRFKRDVNNLIIPVNFYLKGIDILRCLFCTYFCRPKIKGRVSFYNCGITFLISAELFQDISTTHFFNSFIQYYFCIRLAESVSIDRFIYTFENYSWEKMSILGLRRKSSNIKIIAFQHAFISKNSFKYFPGAAEKDILPLPDRIVTMGRRTLDIMKRLGDYPDGIFSIGCALRQKYLFQLTSSPRNINEGIFVAMTITVEDTVKVLHFLFASGLGSYPEKIYLRFHPAIDVDSVIKNLEFSLPDNFIISDNPPIHSEMERCSVVLYTWTTVCLEALKMGRPVIYLDVNYPLEVDPLFECSYLKDICKRPSDLIKKIKEMKDLDDRTFEDEFKKAQDYLHEYFVPVSKEHLSPFIS